MFIMFYNNGSKLRQKQFTKYQGYREYQQYEGMV